MKFDCKDCKMKFEKSDELMNHKKKFCINSDYGNVERLDNIYRDQKLAKNMQQTNNLVDRNIQQNPISKPSEGYKQNRIQDVHKMNNLAQVGSQTLQDLRQKIQNDEYNLLRLKDRRDNEDQGVQGKDDYFVQEMIYLKNEMELNFRNDQNRIKQAVQNIEDENMKGEDQVILVHKLQKLNNLLREREDLRNAEFQLLKDFEEQQQKKLEFLTRKQVAGVKLNSDENTQNILKSRKMVFDKERNRILSELEQIEKNQVQNLFRQKNISQGAQYYPQQQQQPQYQQYQQYQQNHQQQQPQQTVYSTDNPPLEVHIHTPEGTTQIYTGQKAQEILQKEQQQQYQPSPQYAQQAQQNYFQQPQPIFYQQPPQNIFYPIPFNQNQNQFLGQTIPQQYLNQGSFQQQQIDQNLIQTRGKISREEEDEYQEKQKLKQKIQQQEIEDEEDLNDNFAIFTHKKEYLVQNDDYNKDLTKEEKLLLQLNRQEVDELRILSELPQGTELYRFKLEQFKEFSTTKNEIEKIVLEQRLAKVKRDFELKKKQQEQVDQNKRWIDQQRKQIIQSQIE